MVPSPPTDPTDPTRWSARTERIGFAIAVGWLLIVSATRLDSTALWADEAWSLAAVNHLGMSLSSTAANMGGYYVVLWAWGRISTATWWLRALSVVVAIATLWLTRRIAREIGGRRLATIAPVLLACSPMFVFTATEARGYALETLVTVACWWCALRIVSASGPTAGATRVRWCAAMTALALVGPMLHGLFFAQLVACCALALLDPKPWRSIRWLAVPAAATALATLSLWVWGLDTAGSVLVGTPAAIFRSWRRWFLNPNDLLAVGLLVLAVIGVAVCIAQARAATSRVHRAAWAIPALWTLVPTVVLLAVKTFHMMWANYYSAGIAPGLALLVGVGLTGAIDRVSARSPSPAGHAPVVRTGAVVAILAVALSASLLARPVRMDESWRAAVQAVVQHAEPGDGIVFLGDPERSPVQSRAPFEAAWREVDHARTPTPISPARPFGEVQRIDTYLTLDELRAQVARYPRIWVIDYANFDRPRGVLESPPFTTDFTRTSDRTFPGDINLTLFTRRAS